MDDLINAINSIYYSVIMQFTSIGSVIQYVIDCLDGRWDGFIDFSKQLKLQFVWRKEY